ncbi:redoxin domain-containing protein [Sulfitobacter sabulilitoris]|uniref:Redoxin domain-containing protein n=1 Tax=Sulfitobacter sabulilitoris TaxID=2562655 RepID=A0A5S3PKL7_9RHOB|nr:redoxin domain-containing protein [Sulfitobacter sabulilitoris]TMM52746.1 redoxin domain-containing protein [Sulfitobacter sabulilitoris]
MIFPDTKTPDLRLPTLSHGPFDLSKPQGRNGTLVVFYRGLHCPLCIKQMGEIEQMLPEFEKREVDVVLVSADPAEKAVKTVEKAGVSKVRVAHSLALSDARDDWGLYISSARDGSEEPAMFNEPGIFYVRPDGSLYASWVQTAPFARPRMEDVVKALDFAIDKAYPPRGTVQAALAPAA